ncbi:hypothetical protein EDD11_001930 [Mortierella claussenii]|nr:hypothetical protein EDD11_001930 [Mortierella claussenii]
MVATLEYKCSPDNYMDIAEYVTPVIGSILFLRADYSNMDNDHGPDQIWVMGFSILALYMNILLKLRVIKQLKIMVNIILDITRRIAGRYDPVSKSFDDGSTGFHIMMVIFFFFTAILLLNILIALMNDAFNESKDQGQLAWLKQWSEVIAEVEVYLMTQGARQNRNYFPDYIYYGANEQQAELYESKYYIANKSNLSIENRFLVDTVSLEQNATQLGQRALIRDVQTLSKEIDRLKQTQSGFNQDMTKLTELMAAFLAHTTTVSYSDSELMSPASPVEQDPPVSGTSPTSVPEASTPTGAVSAPPTTPKALAFPGGAMRASAAVQPRTSSTTIQQPLPPPGAMRRKVSATAPDTESPIADSPTKHFNTPQSSIDDVGVPIPLTGHGQSTEQLPGGMASDDYASAPRPPLRPPPPLPVVVSAGKLSSSASPSSSTHGAASPYKVGDIPDFSRHVSGDKGASQPSLRRRLQQNLTAVHTVDDALKSQHQQLQENNASHPMYVNLGAEEEKVEVSTMVPAHHSAYYSTSSSSSSTSWQVQQQQQSSQAYQYQGPHAPLELPDNPRRTQSDIVAPTIPRVDVPMHTVHVARPSASSSHPSEEVLLDEEQDEL